MHSTPSLTLPLPGGGNGSFLLKGGRLGWGWRVSITEIT